MKTAFALAIGLLCMTLGACWSSRKSTYDPTYLAVICIREGRC